MNASPSKIAVIGAGPMGLTAAYELCRQGHRVTLFERDDRIGGMSASIDFDGTRLERYYHFVCKPDTHLFEYLADFDLSHKLKWVETTMSFFHEGKVHPWGTPFALLGFPGLSLVDKLRYAAHVMWTRRIEDWHAYDTLRATEWLQKWLGQNAYDLLWRKLFYYKFYELQDELSAAWIGTRIKRVALSRKNLFREETGYIEGGSEVLLQAMAERIQKLGGKIELRAEISRVVIEDEKIKGLQRGAEFEAFDQVISTIPMPYLLRVIPDLPKAERSRVEAIRNVGVVCVLLKLKRPYTSTFWLNINDPRIEIPGIIEYTNLNPLNGKGGPAIVYAPYYMPQTNPKYRREPAVFIEETLQALEIMRPDFDRKDVIAATASRYEFAQTVCSVGFYDALVPMRSRARGLYMADTSHCYPEDRAISESIRIGQVLAQLAQDDSRQKG
ncbi:MAG TPA: NAD(P)/FAD-dependent oxidoreductase [Polyangiaceae bacterium]|nr:NAD(P)/FAD-dependent oxidoreductase [Polyangiaceae bacterium]